MLLHPLLCWISEFCPRVSIWESHTSWSKWLPCPCGKLHETLLNTTCDQFLLTVKTTENTSFLLQVTIFHKKLQGEGHGFPNPFVLDDSLVAWNMEFQGDGERLFHAARRFFLCGNSTRKGEGIYRCLGEFWLILLSSCVREMDDFLVDLLTLLVSYWLFFCSYHTRTMPKVYRVV